MAEIYDLGTKEKKTGGGGGDPPEINEVNKKALEKLEYYTELAKGNKLKGVFIGGILEDGTSIVPFVTVQTSFMYHKISNTIKLLDETLEDYVMADIELDYSVDNEE